MPLDLAKLKFKKIKRSVAVEGGQDTPESNQIKRPVAVRLRDERGQGSPNRDNFGRFVYRFMKWGCVVLNAPAEGVPAFPIREDMLKDVPAPLRMQFYASRTAYEPYSFVGNVDHSFLRRLCFTPSQIPIERVGTRQYRVPEAFAKSWKRLESALLWSVKVMTVDLNSSFTKGIPFPCKPSRFDFSGLHVSEAALRDEVMKAHNAFKLILSALRFLFAHHQMRDVDLFDEKNTFKANPWAFCMGWNGCHRSWLDMLRTVLAGFDRPSIGTFVRVGDVGHLVFVQEMLYRKVPLVFCWSLEDKEHGVKDVHNLKIPREDKCHLMLSDEERSRFVEEWYREKESNGGEFPSIVPVILPPVVNDVSSDWSAPDEWSSGVDDMSTWDTGTGSQSDWSSIDPKAATSTLSDIAHWRTYIQSIHLEERRKEVLEDQISRHRRFQHKQHADKFELTHESSARVYLWSPGEGEKFTRKHLTRAEAQDIWDDYSRGAKLYRSFANSWEIIPMLVPNDPGEQSTEDEDMDSDDEAPRIRRPAWGATFVHSTIDESLQAWDESQAATLPADSWRDLIVAASRHGVEVDCEAIYPRNAQEAYVPFVERMRRRFGFQVPKEEYDGMYSDDVGNESFNSRVLLLAFELMPPEIVDQATRRHLVTFFRAMVDKNSDHLPPPCLFDLSPSCPSPFSRTNSRLLIQSTNLKIDTSWETETTKEGETEKTKERYYMLSVPGSSCHFSVYVKSACIALDCARFNPATIAELLIYLARRGSPFLTGALKQKLDVLSLRQTVFARVPYNIGVREEGYQPDNADLETYRAQVREFLESPRGRAVFKLGGLYWRIAMDCKSWRDCGVLFGPSEDLRSCSQVIRWENGRVEIDDCLTPKEIEFICGTYAVYTGHGTQTASRSWWPRAPTLRGSFLDVPYWTESCEQWYQDKLKNPRLLSTVEWKKKMNQNARPRVVLQKNEYLSKLYLTPA